MSITFKINLAQLVPISMSIPPFPLAHLFCFLLGYLSSPFDLHTSAPWLQKPKPKPKRLKIVRILLKMTSAESGNKFSSEVDGQMIIAGSYWLF